MKIEIAESLISSWLSHVQNCQVVQTNWKIAPSPSFDKEHFVVNSLYEKGKIYFGNRKIETIVRQAECDVLGIKFNCNGKIEAIHAVDVAFHTNGLGYGNRAENVKRIIKKSLRTAICIYGGLHIGDKIKVYIYFATPLITDDEYDEADKALRDINNFYEKSAFKHLKFQILANRKFYNDVVNQVINLYSTVHDTNELFLRSYQLWKMGEGFTKKANNKKVQLSLPNTNSNSGKSVSAFLANVVLRELLTSITLEEKELEELTKNEILFNVEGKRKKEEIVNKKDLWYKDSIKQSDQEYWIIYDCRSKSKIEKLQDFINRIQDKYKDELRLYDEEVLFLV